MTSPGQPEPKGTLGGAGPGLGISDPESPPTLSGAQTLGQLKDQLPRLQLRVSTQLESIFHLLTEVQQDLQEHHRQVSGTREFGCHCPALKGQEWEQSRVGWAKGHGAS
ncbi:transducin-like enhancer protein 6 [Marmota marmota marmota]|uniref:transducin-like enhancer protein 6 n=1 Tax=Marmota marmota marmota TaxID=9994 RepID=UPI0020936080|nr:transducin-like enhancer protein 6 [Marmota marmota marmota]